MSVAVCLTIIASAVVAIPGGINTLLNYTIASGWAMIFLWGCLIAISWLVVVTVAVVFFLLVVVGCCWLLWVVVGCCWLLLVVVGGGGL